MSFPSRAGGREFPSPATSRGAVRSRRAASFPAEAGDACGRSGRPEPGRGARDPREALEARPGSAGLGLLSDCIPSPSEQTPGARPSSLSLPRLKTRT